MQYSGPRRSLKKTRGSMGSVTLLGVVDTESDKTVAGLRAREVPGSFAVENELVVEGSKPKSTRE